MTFRPLDFPPYIPPCPEQPTTCSEDGTTASDLGASILEAAASAFAVRQREREAARLERAAEAEQAALRDAEVAIRKLFGSALPKTAPIQMAVVPESGYEESWFEGYDRPRAWVRARVGELHVRVTNTIERELAVPVVRWHVSALLPCLATTWLGDLPTGRDRHWHQSPHLDALADLGAFATEIAEGDCDEYTVVEP